MNQLTKRELQTLSLMAGGLSNKEISERLEIAIPTVKCYINQIYTKLDLIGSDVGSMRVKAVLIYLKGKNGKE